MCLTAYHILVHQWYLCVLCVCVGGGGGRKGAQSISKCACLHARRRKKGRE